MAERRLATPEAAGSTPASRSVLATKVCSQCHWELPLAEFPPKGKGKRRSMCRECWHELGHRAYRYQPSTMVALARRRERYARSPKYVRDPEKLRARNLVKTALRNGTMQKQPCEVCGASRAHAHHEDYGRPLEVRWLCTRHHGAVHRKTISAVVRGAERRAG